MLQDMQCQMTCGLVKDSDRREPKGKDPQALSGGLGKELGGPKQLCDVREGGWISRTLGSQQRTLVSFQCCMPWLCVARPILQTLLLLTPPKLHTPGHSALPSQHLALPPDVS